VRARAAVTLVTLLAGASASACAAIWGFQDATDVRDASTDGYADTTVDNAEDRSADQGTGDVAPGDGGFVDTTPDADASCPVCVAAPPNGWVGPYAIEQGMTVVGCANGSYPAQAYVGYAEASAPPASCTCACGTPEGGTCSDPVANYWFDNTCTFSCGTPNQAIQVSCTLLGGSGCNHFTLSASVPSGGACPASPTTAVPEAGWTATAILCASEAGTGGCDAGSVCTPKAGFPYATGTYCVATTGAAMCPASYPNGHTYYGPKGTDTRGCTPCTCGVPDGSACVGGTTTFYDQPGCSHNPAIEPMPTGCTNFPDKNGSGTYSGETPSGGSCLPSGGIPSGTFTPDPTSATTICCNQ
jgi:hypothetical protein